MAQRRWTSKKTLLVGVLAVGVTLVSWGASALPNDTERVPASPTSDVEVGGMPTTPRFSNDDVPDLIRAIGDRGVEGFVKKEDLLGPEEPPSSPREALALQQAAPAAIPVYARDGVTVVDSLSLNRSPDAARPTDAGE